MKNIKTVCKVLNIKVDQINDAIMTSLLRVVSRSLCKKVVNSGIWYKNKVLLPEYLVFRRIHFYFYILFRYFWKCRHLVEKARPRYEVVKREIPDWSKIGLSFVYTKETCTDSDT